MGTNLSCLPAVRLLACARPLVIGHRGDCESAPENTLPAFRLAQAAGTDLIELDGRQSKDGQLVVIHDPVLDRTTDAVKRWGRKRITVAARTAEEIRSLDAGSWFGAKYAGVKVPLLEEALETICKGSVALIELKAGYAEDYLRLLREKDLINRVVVQSFDWACLRFFHEQEPAQILGALGPPTRLADGKRRPPLLRRRLNAAWLDAVKTTGARIIVWNRRLSKKAVQLAHQRGLRVWAYTIDNPAVALRLIDAGLDGIITNNASLMRETIKRPTSI